MNIEEIEKFYSDMERGTADLGPAHRYVRPADYVERYMRVISGSRKPHTANQEGLTKKKTHE